ncbi:hypothetical protein ACWD4Z_36295 [Streptomyces antibioticus]|uniref:hypothetical protein n=1 Tax=Streptomyces antibioticus TaxID=1890 RepID=UPI00340B793E
MMSMIRTQLAADDGAPIALLYSNRARQEVIFGDELDRPAAAHRGRLPRAWPWSTPARWATAASAWCACATARSPRPNPTV